MNNIYDNKYGINISNGATANAENNYWGSLTGPYHPSINPEGQGNPVNGVGTDLDFIPYINSPINDILILKIFIYEGIDYEVNIITNSSITNYEFNINDKKINVFV